MGPESFENIVSKKFEGKSLQVPAHVWDNVNNSLNADLVTHYQSSHTWYRWLTAAAILIAVSSFVIQYTSLSFEEEKIGATYNALLSDDVDFSQFNDHANLDQMIFSWAPVVVVHEEKYADEIIDEGHQVPSQNIYAIDIIFKKPEVELAVANNFILPYYRVLQKSIPKTPKEKAFWAGVEAGAGKYNSNFYGANSITSSVNSAAAATAVGAGDFANPSASATQNGMDEGTATSFGFDFGLKLGKKWTLESGLAYTNINNNGSASINVLEVFSNKDGTIHASRADANINGAGGRERAGDSQGSVSGEVDLKSNIQFASLPLKAGYYLMDNRFSLRLNAGVAANYLIETSLSDPTSQVINSTQPNLYNDWSFDGIGGLEFGYRLFNRIDMTIEPNYRHAITPISNTISSPSRFAVQTGFRYTLR